MDRRKFFNRDESNNIKNLIKAHGDYIKKNDYENALLKAKKLVKVRDHIDDWMAYAKCQFYLGQYFNAIESFTVIINVNNENIDAWINLGSSLNNVGRYDEALSCFDYVCELKIIDPGSIEALDVLVNMATVLNNLQRFKESTALFHHITKAKPDFVCVWLNRGVTVLKQKRYEEALSFFNQALLIEPSNENILIKKGVALESLKRSQEAISCFDLALEINPNNFLCWLERGVALTSILNYEEAVLSFNQSLKLNDTNSKAWLYKGILLSELGFYTRAIDSFNKLKEQGDQSYSFLANYAVTLLALEDWDRGFNALSSAIESLPLADEFDEQFTVKIVSNLLYSSNEGARWQLPIHKLIELYDRHSISYKLARGLTKSISRLVSLIFEGETVKEWRDIWRELTFNRPEFHTPLRLLNIAIDYRETKGSPLIYLGLSKEDENLFKSLLGVEQSPNPLDESKLIFDAGFVALNGYRLLGRGVVCFFGEKPRYIKREENMPSEVLALVDDYLPEREFIVIPSNHTSAMLLEFDEIKITASMPLSDNRYRQELEKLLEQLVQQGLNKDAVSSLRQIALTERNKNLKLNSYPPEILSTFQDLSEEVISGNSEPLINFLNRNISDD